MNRIMGITGCCNNRKTENFASTPRVFHSNIFPAWGYKESRGGLSKPRVGSSSKPSAPSTPALPSLAARGERSETKLRERKTQNEKRRSLLNIPRLERVEAKADIVHSIYRASS